MAGLREVFDLEALQGVNSEAVACDIAADQIGMRKRGSISRNGTPARPEPRSFITAQSQPGNHLAHDIEGLVPSCIPSAELRFLRLPVVREDPLLSVRILEVPDVQGRVIAINDRWITAVTGVVVTDTKQGFGHGGTSEKGNHSSLGAGRHDVNRPRHGAQDRTTRGLSCNSGVRGHARQRRACRERVAREVMVTEPVEYR